MNHESFRELMALHLYGELDESGRARLEQHLRSCADCRRFSSELSSGLGALREAPASHDTPEWRSPSVEHDTAKPVAGKHDTGEIPADWRQRLRRSTVEEQRRARLSPLWSSVAAFAAGILLATIAMHRASGDSGELVARNDRAAMPSIYERFNGSNPPPRATTAGQLARLGDYLKR